MLLNLVQLFYDLQVESDTTKNYMSKSNDKINELEMMLGVMKQSFDITVGANIELKEKTKEIESVINVTTAIANQINLLALNASIEAARAGEHGKGFKVVADEVKKLAEQSNKAIQEIGEKLESINEKVDESFQQTNGTDRKRQGSEAHHPDRYGGNHKKERSIQ